MTWTRLGLLAALANAGCAAAESRREAADAEARRAESVVADGGTSGGADEGPQPEPSQGHSAQADAALRETAVGPAQAARATAADSGTMPEVDADDAGPGPSADCPPPEGDLAAALEALTLEVSDEPPVGAPFAVGVSTRSGTALSGAVQLCANGAQIATLQLYRGRGSISLRMPEPGPLQLQVRATQAYGATSISVRERPARHFESTPDAGVQAHEWTASEDVVIEGVQRIAASESLTIGPGTRVLLGENAVLSVAGELRVQGSAEAPVLFTRSGPAAWGGVNLVSGARGSFSHAWFVAGGGDPSRAFGHSDSQPVIRVDASSLEMRGGGLIDNVGKAFGSDRASLALDHVLISRCDTGGQFQASQLSFKHLHVLELPDADGRFDDDDNDGFYVYHSMSDATEVEAVIEDSVFAVGEDDAIDHNGAQLRIERVFIEGFRHEGVACSSGREVYIRDSVIQGCEQGVESGYGAPRVHVENSLITGNGVGVRYGDNYDWETSGSLEVSHSIITGNQENLRNYVTMQMAPAPEALRVACSIVDDPQFAGAAGNVPPPEEATWAADSCSAEPLLDAQTCETATAGPRCLTGLDQGR